MATMITDDCINCGACEPECPNPAIREDELTLYERAVRLHGVDEVVVKEDLDAETSRFRNPDWDDHADDSAVPGEDWSPYWHEE